MQIIQRLTGVTVCPGYLKALLEGNHVHWWVLDICICASFARRSVHEVQQDATLNEHGQKPLKCSLLIYLLTQQHLQSRVPAD